MVVEGTNDDHPEQPAEDVSTATTTTEKDTHIAVSPEGPTTPTLPTDSTGPAASGDSATPTRCAPLFWRSRQRQRYAPDRLRYPFESSGQLA